MSSARKNARPATPAAPQPGRRLSALRVLLSLVLVSALTAGGFVGWNWWSTAQAAEPHEPWFAAYVDVTATPTFPFETPDSDAARDVVLSFIVASKDDPCEPTWGTAFTLDEAAQALDLDRRLERLERSGGQVIVSFGGLLNDELATGCTNQDELVDAYATVLDRYDVTTIDLDIEAGNLTDGEAGDRRAAAISELQADRRADGDDLAVWLTLPVAPSGMTEDGTTAVRQMLDAGVDLAGVNVMTMDYGSSLPTGDTMAEGSAKALESTHRQLSALYSRADIPLSSASIWSKIGATPMIGQNDVRDEVFGIADAKEFAAFALEKRIGRMSMWSLNRDRTCGDNYADLKRVSDSCSGITQGDVRFVDLLGSGFEGRPELSASAVTTEDVLEEVVDDPATSPYPIWAAKASYLKGTKIVWHRNVYKAKWWTRGELPDNPVLNEWETAWTLIGPVLPGEKPFELPTVPAGTYPEWDGPAVYQKGNRVLFEGTPYESKWWNQGESPEAASSNPDGSPWAPLTAADVGALTEALEESAG
ncbi:chitinase [Planctomonas psychrotolerans]|uniref:chitinase n=1 Tax=Planctomonas psychrotolerans TaxID=2528712 RepID=UPI00123C2073|nr:glycosyl hydrolase family 18 protein [Planctomonas psychrotolerans]